MPENISGQQARLDNLDGKIDKKISVVDGKEEELTGVYIDKVDNLVASLSILPEHQKEDVKEAVITSLKGINAVNIEEQRASFDQSLNRWIANIDEKIIKRMESKKAIQKAKEETMEGSSTLEKLQKEAFDKSAPMKTKKSAQKRLESLKVLREEVGDDETLVASIDAITMLLETTVEELDGLIKKHGLDPLLTDFSILKKIIEIQKLEDAAEKYEKYIEIRGKIYEYSASDDLSQRAVDENGVSNLQGDIDGEIGKMDGWTKDLREVQAAFDAITYTVAFGMDTEADEITYLNEYPRKGLETLKASDEYFAIRNEFLLFCTTKPPAEISEETLVKYHGEIERRKVEGSPILDEDFTQILNSIKQELVGRKTDTLKKDIAKDIEENIGSEYVEIKYFPEGGIDAVYTEVFLALPPGEQMLIQNQVRKLGLKIKLKSQEALLPIESRNYMTSYYEANQKVAGGDLMGAKKLYLSALGNLKAACSEGEEKPDEALALKDTIGNLKQIAMREAGRASTRITLLERSVNNTSNGWAYGMTEGKFGVPKVTATQMVKVQKVVLGLITDIINADNEVCTYEDAVAIVEKLDYNKMEPILNSLGLSYTSVKNAQSNFGNWDSTGISYWQSKFGTEHSFEGEMYGVKGGKYFPAFDAIKAIVAEGGSMDKAFLKDAADKYKEMGLYDVAEATYNLYFKELYKQEAKGSMDLGTFMRNYRKNPKRMREINKEIDAFEDELLEKEGKVLSPKEKEMMKTDMLKRKWEKALKLKITNKANAGQIGEPEGSEWLEYNEDILQVDREFYELWRGSCKEWDDFMEFLPADIVFTILTAGGAHMIGKTVTKAIAKKMLTKELAKLGIRQAFKQGGIKLARTALVTGVERITPKMVGFFAESIAFAELGMAVQGIRSGDLSALIDYDAQKANIGHSILTLGAIRGVTGGLNIIGLKGLAKKGVMGRVAHTGIATTADAIALTGINVGIAAMGSEYMSPEERDALILTNLRHNIALSVGIRAGQGLASVSTKSARIVSKISKGERVNLTKKDILSFLPFAAEEAIIAREFVGSKSVAREGIPIELAAEKVTASKTETAPKAETKGERVGVDKDEDDDEDALAEAAKKSIYRWEPKSIEDDKKA